MPAIYPLFSLIRSKSSSLCPNVWSYSRAKLSRMLARVPSLGITQQTPWWKIIGLVSSETDRRHHFPQGSQNFPALFGSGVDNNYPALYQLSQRPFRKWATYHLRLGQGPLSCAVRIECEDPAVLDFNRKVDICATFKTVFTGLFEEIIFASGLLLAFR